MNKFWMVLVDGKPGPTKKHTHKTEAIAESGRLYNIERRRVYLLEVVGFHDSVGSAFTDYKTPPPAEAYRPKVICLCGSTKFKEAFEKAERDITLRGEICLTVGLFGHIEGLDMSGVDKSNLDALHLRKIDMADEIFIVSVNGYIGTSTINEIRYATKKGKPIKFMETSTEQEMRLWLEDIR